MRSLVAAPTFYVLSVLLLPITLLGYVIWIARLLLARRSGASATAQGPLSARWVQHHLGTRLDAPASRLLMVVPGISPLAVRLVFAPTLLAHRFSGYVPPTFRYPFAGAVSLQNQAAARQTFYDAVVDRYLPVVTQFVILGAGFDTRAFRLPPAMRIRSFELDTPATLTIKHAMLKKAQIDPAQVTFVATDFEQEQWHSRLMEAGFKVDQPALFLWEGVTPYLDRTAVEATLRTVGNLATGSIIAFDYITTDVLESPSLYLRLVRASLRAGGEPLTFGIDSTPPTSERLADLLGSCGLSLVEQRTVGEESGGKRAWGGFAVAMVR